MPTLADIDEAKKECVAVLDSRIDAAQELLNDASGAAAAKLVGVIDQLTKKRLDIFTQKYIADLKSEAMKDALDVIKQATKDMNEVAQTMKTVTDFINKAAALLGAGATVLPALKGTNS